MTLSSCAGMSRRRAGPRRKPSQFSRSEPSGAPAWKSLGEATQQRLYQLIRQRGPVRERTFEITFLAPGVEAYAFTFGEA
jgi:Thioredoxin like C-terminal domain